MPSGLDHAADITTRAPALPEAAVVGVCASLNIGFLLWDVLARPALNPDFRGPWSFVRFARHHAAELYSPAPLQAFQQQIYPGFKSFFPYQYPPSFLLPLWWLGDCRFAAAEAIWTMAGLLLLGLAAAIFFQPGCRRFAVLALLASPASLLNGAAGETGYFTAAFLLFGFAWLPARPALAGIAFGLLALKPQLGVLIPIVFAARGDWRALASSCMTVLALAALSCALFPATLWLDWLRCLPGYQAHYLTAGETPEWHNIVTLAGNLIALGCRPPLAWSLQAAACLGGGAAVFLAFRRAPYRLAVATFFAGMFLCTPHAYAYDTIPLTAAMLLSPPAGARRAIYAVIYLAPYLLLTPFGGWFLYAIAETLLFIGIIYLAIGPFPRPNARYEPVPATESRATTR